MQVIVNMEVTVINATSADSVMAKGCKSCYTQVICVKTILISALLAIGYCIRGTQREYSSKPHKHSIVERTLVFKR